ncbi:hypothetical protein MPSEU_001054200 [Mayamaea pseudoterrestris]|nr:hypothetical protein MPSEU_001054200 [Mayamaea pseudoterrestris]
MSSKTTSLRRSTRIVSATATMIATSSLPRSASSFVATTSSTSLDTPPRSRTKQVRRVTPDSSSNEGSPKLKKQAIARTRRTESFGVLLHSTLLPDCLRPTEPHTLILGTHPSIASLERHEYFGHDMNAFWWIVGDCLGFRRKEAVSPSSNKPYAFAAHLRHETIIPYSEQLERFVAKGFCLWDVVQSCERPGSLDQDIRKEIPNDIQTFVQAHPSIRRIVFANGSTGCKLFVKHFREWLASGELVPLQHEGSINVFGKYCSAGNDNDRVEQQRKVALVCALAVSPAATRWTYEQKRNFWDQYVYGPGLDDFERSNGKASEQQLL